MEKVIIKCAPNYSIDKGGNVYSKRGILTGTVKNGYRRVGLIVDGKHGKFMVHRLLALAFLPNPDNLPSIDHINGNRLDNELSNLKWVSALQNNHNRKAKGFTKHGDRWQAKIASNHVHYHLGVFDTEQEAHEAYKVARLVRNQLSGASINNF